MFILFLFPFLGSESKALITKYGWGLGISNSFPLHPFHWGLWHGKDQRQGIKTLGPECRFTIRKKLWWEQFTGKVTSGFLHSFWWRNRSWTLCREHESPLHSTCIRWKGGVRRAAEGGLRTPIAAPPACATRRGPHAVSEGDNEHLPALFKANASPGEISPPPLTLCKQKQNNVDLRKIHHVRK